MKKTTSIISTIIAILAVATLGVVGYFTWVQGEDDSANIRTYLGEWIIFNYLYTHGPTNVILREDDTFTVSQPGRYIPETGWMDMFFTPFADLLPGFSEREAITGGTSWDYLVVTHGTFSVERRSITFALSDGSTVNYDFAAIGDEHTTFRRLRMNVTRVPATSLHINRMVFERVY